MITLSSVRQAKLENDIEAYRKKVTTISPHWTARAKNVIRQSLIDTNRQDIADKLDACNSRSSRCGNFFCPSCNERYREIQIELAMNHFAAKYEGDFQLAHDNIKQLTIIHSILPFDDIGGSHKVKLTLSTAELLAKMKRAKLAFNDLQKRFPDVRMIGAFDIETLTTDMLDDRERKKRALQSLKDWPIKFPTEHFLELHSHSVVDLNGTNAAEFDAWVRKKWKQKDHPYRIQIDSLHKDKHPTNSVMRMSAYQIKHPFSLIRYNMPSTNKASAISNTKSGFISDEVIAALVSGFNDISVRSIVFRIGDW